MALKGNQKKLDKNNNNRIDAQDFKILKAEKAKGRGMGLQDESVKPGKVMKAKEGKLGEAKDYKKYLEGLKEATKSSKAKRVGEAAVKAAKATRLGKIVLPIAAAGVAAQQYLKSKLSSKEDRNKKMLRDYREQKKPGVPSQKTQDINKALNRLNSKKMGGGMMKYTKGGGADTGTAGERRSKLMTAIDSFKRRIDVRKRRPKYIKPPERKPMIPAGVGKIAESLTATGIGKQMGRKAMGKMGGGMIGASQMPKYSKGTMIMARGCKLGRKKATKIT